MTTVRETADTPQGHGRLDQVRRLLNSPAPQVPGQLAAPAPGPRIGSVCSGYRGLDMAVEAVFGGTTAWVSDIDPGANKILTHHWPDVPNLGDLTTVDWAAVEPVDIFCGGYPCQPFSNAGKRKGTQDDRHIWPWIARALGVLRPRLAIFENVANHLRLGFADVLADLAELGFDAEWCTVRASEIGAPHQRNRLFLLATATDAPHLGHERAGSARGRGHGSANLRHAATDTGRPRLAVGRVEPDRNERQTAERGSGEPAPNAGRRGCKGHGELSAGRDALQQGVRSDTPRCDTAPAADAERLGLQGQRGNARAYAERAAAAAVGRGPTRGSVPAAADEPTCPTCLCPKRLHDAAGLCDGCLHCTDPELGQPGSCPADCPFCADEAAADTTRVGRGEGRPEPARLEGRPGTPGGGAPHRLGGSAPHPDRGRRGADQPDVRAGQPNADWGRFAPAIARWEHATGRRAPWATDDRNRLSPEFVEWLMGLPAGHVTQVPGLTRTQMLHALGNGVVPQQAEAALRLLAARVASR